MGLPDNTRTLDYQTTTAKMYGELIQSAGSLEKDDVVAFFPERGKVTSVLGILNIARSKTYHPRSIIDIPGVRVISDTKKYDNDSSRKDSRRTIVWTRPRSILPLIESSFDYAGETFLGSDRIGFYLLGKAALLRYFASEHFTG